jgi:hypothetical protein
MLVDAVIKEPTVFLEFFPAERRNVDLIWSGLSVSPITVACPTTIFVDIASEDNILINHPIFEEHHTYRLTVPNQTAKQDAINRYVD